MALSDQNSNLAGGKGADSSNIATADIDVRNAEAFLESLMTYLTKKVTAGTALTDSEKGTLYANISSVLNDLSSSLTAVRKELDSSTNIPGVTDDLTDADFPKIDILIEYCQRVALTVNIRITEVSIFIEALAFLLTSKNRDYLMSPYFQKLLARLK